MFNLHYSYMKNLILILVFTPLVSLAQTPHQLLWEVSGNGLNQSSFIYGTLHTNDKRVFDFSDSVFIALEQAKTIVLETNVFELFGKVDPREEDVSLEYDSSGDPFSSSWEPTTTLYGNEDGMPQFMDAFFEQYAYNTNKSVRFLEKLQSQLNIATPAVDNDEASSWNEYFISEDEMIDIYLTGNIRRLEDEVRTALSDYPEYYNELIVKRNKKMFNGIDTLLHQSNCFVAVGASHLAGNQGLLALLSAKGYKIRPVKYINSDERIDAERSVFDANEYIYRYEDLGLNIRFPGKPIEIKPANDAYLKKIIYRDLGQGNTYQVEILAGQDEISFREQAEELIASPSESPVRMITLENGGEAYEGIANAYPEGLSWMRIIATEDVVIIIKTYGGNKYMNSNRYQLFFDSIWFD